MKNKTNRSLSGYFKKFFLLFLFFLTSLFGKAQNFQKIFADTTIIKNDLWKKESLSHFLDSVNVYGDDFDSYFNQGLNKMRDSMFVEAIEYFKKAKEKDAYITTDIPSLNKKQFKADAIFNIGVCFNYLKNSDSAEYYFGQAVKTNPYKSEAYQAIASIRASKDDKKGVICILDSAVHIVPGSSKLKYDLAIAYLMNGKISKAKRIQRQIIEQNPHYNKSYILLGFIYLLEGKDNASLSILTRSVEENPDDEMSYYIRGSIYLHKKDYVNAYKDYLKYYEIDSLNPTVKGTLAILDFKFGQATEGLAKLFELMNDKVVHSSGFKLAPPWAHEMFYLLKTCNTDTFPRRELTYVENFYKERFWGKIEKTKLILDEYESKFPASLYAKRFSIYFNYNYRNEYGINSDTVLQEMNHLLSQNPNIANLWFFMADFQSYLNKDSLAIISYKKGLNIDTGYFYPYYACGTAYKKIGLYDSAIVWYDNAIRKDTDYVEAIYFKAMSKCKIPGRERKAISVYKGLLKILRHGDYIDEWGRANTYDVGTFSMLNRSTSIFTMISEQEILLNVATCYSNINEYDSAMIYLDKILEDQPNRSDVLEKRAYAYLQTGRFQEAISEYDKILVRYNNTYYKDPYRARFYFERGQAYFYLKSYEQALENFNNALQIVPKDAGSICGIGDCYRNMGNYDKALKYYDKAIKIDPDSKWYYFKKAYCYLQSGVYLESIQYFGKATFLDPYFAEAYEGMGRSYYKMGKYQQSVRFFQKALSLNPALYQSSFNIAAALLRLGYHEEAYKIYTQTFQKNDSYSNKDFSTQIDDLKEMRVYPELKTYSEEILYDIFNYPVHE